MPEENIPEWPARYLPARAGRPPKTQRRLPHVQLDQWPPGAITEKLIDWSTHLPHIRPRESRMTSPQTRALRLPDEFAHGPRDAFIDDHEFCLLHPAPSGGLHLTLPERIREQVLRTRWGEQHPGAAAGILPATLVMIYAPRDEEELAIVMRLVEISYRFASGGR